MTNHDPNPATPDPAASATPAQDAAAAPNAEVRLQELEARHAEVSDAYLRAKAEAENTRRRADDEIAKARKYAVEAFAESLLPVKDSLEAAIAIPAASNEQLLRRGRRNGDGGLQAVTHRQQAFGESFDGEFARLRNFFFSAAAGVLGLGLGAQEGVGHFGMARF